MQTAAADRPRRRAPHAAVVVAAVVVLVFAAGEVGVRLLDSRLPEPLVWPSFEAQLKVHEMDALAKQGGADVVFVGSSVVNAGMDPAVFDSAVGHGRSYNAALSAGMPLLMEPWTTTTVLPRLHPKLLIIGVTSFELYDHPSSDAFFQAFADSPSGRRALGNDGVLDDIDRWLGDRSDLWAHRLDLRDPKTLADAVRGDAPDQAPEFGPIEADGRASYPQSSLPPSDPRALGPPIDGWTLGTRNPAALRRMIEVARGQGIAVALVDMPVTQRYVDRHPHGEADYERFGVALHELAKSEGVPVFDFDMDRDPGSFVDVVHLSIPAARRFTDRLVSTLRTAGVLQSIGA